MKLSVMVPLANGFEELEAITIIDVLRRAKIDVLSAGLVEGVIQGSRNTRHLADRAFKDVAHELFDMIVLPGGQPGANALKADASLRECVLAHSRAGKWIAAICAAPIILQDLGLLEGKEATSHPSVEAQLTGARYSQERVVVSGKIVTSRGPGTSLEFSLKLVELLMSKSCADGLAAGMLARF